MRYAATEDEHFVRRVDAFFGDDTKEAVQHVVTAYVFGVRDDFTVFDQGAFVNAVGGVVRLRNGIEEATVVTNVSSVNGPGYVFVARGTGLGCFILGRGIFQRNVSDVLRFVQDDRFDFVATVHDAFGQAIADDKTSKIMRRSDERGYFFVVNAKRVGDFFGNLQTLRLRFTVFVIDAIVKQSI